MDQTMTISPFNHRSIHRYSITELHDEPITDLFHSLVEDVLDDLAESLEKRLQLFASLLLVLVLRQLQALFRHGHQRLAVVLFELSDGDGTDGEETDGEETVLETSRRDGQREIRWDRASCGCAVEVVTEGKWRGIGRKKRGIKKNV